MINILVALYIAGFAPTTMADGQKLPEPPLCLEKESCHPYFLATSEAFINGSDPGAIPFIASGVCRHSSYMYNPDVDHFGYVVTDRVEEKTHLGGAFAFFFQENPYENLSLEEGRARDSGFKEERREVAFTDGMIFSDMNKEDPTNPWRYWIRSSAPGEIVVLAQMGRGNFAFCNFRQHP
jgi:hypothetical protein